VNVDKQRWIWVDWLIFSLRCGWYGTGVTFYFVNSERLGDMSFTWFFLFVTLGFFVPLLFWRPNYVQPTYYVLAELILTAGFSIYINNVVGISLSTSILLMPILMVGYLMNRQTAPWAIPLFVILLPANRYWTIDSMFSFVIQYIDVLLFFGIGVGFNLITKSQKRYKHLLSENIKQYEVIQEQNQALAQYAQEVEKLALLEERNRMARDLHDSIGHHFTSITVGLDAISYMVESQPKMAVEKITSLAELARSGLAEVRRTIHEIAPTDDQLPLTDQLKTLVTSFGTHTNTETSFEIRGVEPPIPPHQKLTLVRCLQECMTNAKRHGDAKYIRVKIEYKKDSIVLTVFNNGKRMDMDKFGFGLQSMKRRLEELNGNFQVQNDLEGVVVKSTLPYRR
jgi:signal transduction histidine kinase